MTPERAVTRRRSARARGASAVAYAIATALLALGAVAGMEGFDQSAEDRIEARGESVGNPEGLAPTGVNATN